MPVSLKLAREAVSAKPPCCAVDKGSGYLFWIKYASFAETGTEAVSAKPPYCAVDKGSGYLFWIKYASFAETGT